jgi:hypothetical protein
MKIPPSKTEVFREFPTAGVLRYQFGFLHDRPERLPIFSGISRRSQIIGFRDGPMASVFHLCGHGSTIEKAAKMAGVKLEFKKAA